MSKRYYAEMLGMDLVRETSFGDHLRWVEGAPRGAQTTISLVTWLDDFPAGPLRGLVIDCEDLDATVAELMERGVIIPDGIVQQSGGRFAHIADPDGNRLSRYQAEG